MSMQINQPHRTAHIAEAATTGRLERVDVDGVSRPAQNSLGKAIHPTDEGIQNFWRWFGDSKVVDEHGRPLVVFHGTKRDFDTFNPDSYQASEDSADLRPSGLDPTTYLGSHFSETSEVADSFAQGLYLGKYDGGAGHVYPCYLRVVNPIKFDNEDALLEEIMSQSSDDQSVELEIAKYADENDMDEDAVWAKYDKSKSLRAYINNAALESDNDMEEPSDSLTRGLAEEYRSNIESQGVDGIRYKNMREFGYAWAVFSPNQIKSALGNSGKFSPADHRITASVASVLRAANVPCLYVEAKYSTENSMLKSALSDPEEDGTYVIHEFGPAELYFEYLRENNTDEYKRLVESTKTKDPDDNDLFDAIIGGEYTPDESVVEDFLADTPKQRIEDAIRRYDEGHSQINFSLNNGGKLLPRQTWVGHFCSDAQSIAQRGFIFGESDPRSLGLTMHKSDNARHRTSGYNFGFLLNDLRKNFEGGVHHNDMKYGDELVLFQTSGVSAYHYGDNENQVIFWGPHVDWVIPIVRASVSDDDRHSEDDYAVLAKDGTYAFRTYSSVPKSKSYGFSEQKNLEICVAWVVKNATTYRNSIMWELPKRRIVK